ncbi:hypothetical protein [Kitasatospora sp. NPDC088783]|uniref:hypothetical protein n=1 Tax=Kitasatospora sp. NPDC088783 TaxID=3364077 RepID=UPI003805B526
MNLGIEPHLLRHDLQAGHLPGTPQGHRLLLDWELAAFGEPLSDLARLAVRLKLPTPEPVLAHPPAPDPSRRPHLHLCLHLPADAAPATDSAVHAHAITSPIFQGGRDGWPGHAAPA